MALFTKKYEVNSPRGTCRASDRDRSIICGAECVGSLARVSGDGGPAGANQREKNVSESVSYCCDHRSSLQSELVLSLFIE